MIHASPLHHVNLICGLNGEYWISERNFNSCTRFQRMILHLLSLEITTTSYWTRTSALGKLPHLPKKEMFNFMRKWWCGFCIISNQEQIQCYIYACYVFSARPEKQKFHEGFLPTQIPETFLIMSLLFTVCQKINSDANIHDFDAISKRFLFYSGYQASLL